MLSHHPENGTAQNNRSASLTFILGTRMDLLPWNFAGNEVETAMIIAASQLGEFMTSLSVWFWF